MASVDIDLRLHLAISAAANDIRRRECPWYGVWDMCLNQYMFPHSDSDMVTETTACLSNPQYSLTWTYDVDNDMTPPPNHSSQRTSDLSSIQISPSPPNHISQRSIKIPDFTQILYHTSPTQPEESPSLPCVGKKRVILTIEVKPIKSRTAFDEILNVQVAKQAIHAFADDQDFKSLGVVLACGLDWAYYDAERPHSNEMKHWEKTMINDPDYIPEMPHSSVSMISGESSEVSSALTEAPDVMFHTPDCIEAIMDGRAKFSFEDIPRCKQALIQIAAHLKASNSLFWGLPGNGKCSACTAIEKERVKRIQEWKDNLHHV